MPTPDSRSPDAPSGEYVEPPLQCVCGVRYGITDYGCPQCGRRVVQSAPSGETLHPGTCERCGQGHGASCDFGTHWLCDACWSSAPSGEGMPDYVSKAVALSREMVSTNAPDRKFGYHAVVWLADEIARLTRERDEWREAGE